MNPQMKEIFKLYVRALPLLGLIMGIVFFIIGYFFMKDNLVFISLFSLVPLIGHLVIWAIAKILIKKFDL